ncbi:MAG TPA: FAD-dependent oxidoreductase [Candidatus Dormibacteraeota bacterium]|jgi:2,4-dienoyl-CoA reductase-like NADH-dependent reductase (Old Yellow Enzyme family)/thioredoxin reductase|nr:FAD-dependent oxidoreductase [Candidatus Dormibacteraeota bacterium]
MAIAVGPFKHLFTPVQIGPVQISNRLYTSAHTTFAQTDPTGYDRWTVLGERAVHYYAERAKGGFGLIVAGQLQAHPQGGAYRPGAWTKEARRWFLRISEAVHDNGGRIFAQLNQHGRLKGGSGSGDWAPMWGPSPLLPTSYGLPHRVSGEMTRAMDHDEIRSLVEGYGAAAYNAQQGGIDGVEVHMGHTHLFSEWLMPAFNKRTDQYGGSLENRLRIVVETLESVRRACGRDLALGVRMNLEWPIEGGIEHADAIEMAMLLDQTGLLDYISCTIFPAEASMPTNRLPPGFQIPKAAAIKEAVSIPVLALGRVVDPLEAEKILAAGLVDMVGMTKASIADPELPNKAREGRLDDIRPCIGGQQGCFARIIQDKPLSCTQNPAVGEEKRWGIGTLKPAQRARTVLIAGGGPAGMETAITAARRGHRVILCERSGQLGGQVNLIGKVALRDEFLGVVRWREGQVAKLGVEVRLDTEVTPDLVEELHPDVVVVATGSEPRRNGHYPELAMLPGIPGGDKPHVFSYADVLRGDVDGRAHVVIVDGIGYHQSSDALEYLVARGTRVEGVTSAPAFAADMLIVDRTLWIQGLRGKSVVFHDSTRVHAIHDRSVDVEGMSLNGRRYSIDDVDAVVLSLGNDVNDGLFHSLKGSVRSLHLIGDARAPRRIEQAVHEGHEVGRLI